MINNQNKGSFRLFYRTLPFSPVLYFMPESKNISWTVVQYYNTHKNPRKNIFHLWVTSSAGSKSAHHFCLDSCTIHQRKENLKDSVHRKKCTAAQFVSLCHLAPFLVIMPCPHKGQLILPLSGVGLSSFLLQQGEYHGTLFNNKGKVQEEGSSLPGGRFKWDYMGDPNLWIDPPQT